MMYYLLLFNDGVPGIVRTDDKDYYNAVISSTIRLTSINYDTFVFLNNFINYHHGGILHLKTKTIKRDLYTYEQ